MNSTSRMFARVSDQIGASMPRILSGARAAGRRRIPVVRLLHRHVAGPVQPEHRARRRISCPGKRDWPATESGAATPRAAHARRRAASAARSTSAAAWRPRFRPIRPSACRATARSSARARRTAWYCSGVSVFTSSPPAWKYGPGVIAAISPDDVVDEAVGDVLLDAQRAEPHLGSGVRLRRGAVAVQLGVRREPRVGVTRACRSPERS